MVWAASRPGLLVDDWGYASTVRFGGVWHLFWSAAYSNNPRRPVAGLWYAAVFGSFGRHPLPHALALAALNAASGALVFLVARRLWGMRLAVFAGLAWAALPNRGSSRLWFSVAPTLLAVVLLLAGVLLLLNRHPGWAVAALTCAVLANETVALLALASVLVFVRATRRPLRQAALMAAPLVAAAAFLWSRSPKRETPLKFFNHASRFVNAQLGRGNFGSATAAKLGGTVLIVVVVLVLVRRARERRRAAPEGGMLGQGVAILLVGAAPLLVIGFPFATDGIFDRGNVTPDLGMAVVLGAILTWLSRRRPALLGTCVAVAILAYFGLQNATDLRDYRRAVRQGTGLQRRLATDVPSIDAPLLIGPPLPSVGGVAQFLTDYDTSAALELTRNQPSLLARMACTEKDFEESQVEPLRYDRVRRTLERRSAPPFDRAAFGRHC